MNEEDSERDRATQEEEGLFKADAVNEGEKEEDLFKANEEEEDNILLVCNIELCMVLLLMVLVFIPSTSYKLVSRDCSATRFESLGL